MFSLEAKKKNLNFVNLIESNSAYSSQNKSEVQGSVN